MGNETRKQFEELNRNFLGGCIWNIQSVGSDCCLAPLATNYLLECSNLLKDVEPGQGKQGPPLSDLGQHLRSLGERFIVLGAKMEKKKDLLSLPQPPPPANSFINPQGVTKLLPPLPPPSVSTNSFQFGLGAFGNFHPPPPETNHTSETSSTPVGGADEEEQEKEAQAHEFVPILEDDSLYSIRCKIFHKLKETYEVRGVGQLYIQKTENGSHRLLIRADNSLGNILLNMNITPDIPMTLNVEKKQVLTIDPHKPCPITILVKTPDLAQTLYNEIVKYQKSGGAH